DDARSTDKNNHQFDTQIEGEWRDTYADPQLLKHILTNLLGNAVKYSPPGSGIHLTLARNRNDGAVLPIPDEGIGIAPEDHTHLFDTFHRGSNAQFAKGTGLGLAIVQKSVEEHGGTISFESEVGKGTTFTVRLPMTTKP